MNERHGSGADCERKMHDSSVRGNHSSRRFQKCSRFSETQFTDQIMIKSSVIAEQRLEFIGPWSVIFAAKNDDFARKLAGNERDQFCISVYWPIAPMSPASSAQLQH